MVPGAPGRIWGGSLQGSFRTLQRQRHSEPPGLAVSRHPPAAPGCFHPAGAINTSSSGAVTSARPPRPTCVRSGDTARHLPTPHLRHRGAETPGELCFAKLGIRWSGWKRRGDHIGDGTEKVPLWCVGWVWGGQAGLGLAVDRSLCVSTREGLRAPRIPTSRPAQPPSSGLDRGEGRPNPCSVPGAPTRVQGHRGCPHAAHPPPQVGAEQDVGAKGGQPPRGEHPAPSPEAFPLSKLPGLTTWRDPCRPLRFPAGGGGRPPARCCSCRSDRALARLRRHRRPGYGQRRDLARAPAAVQGPDAAGRRGGAMGKGRGREEGGGAFTGGSRGLGAPWGWECSLGLGGLYGAWGPLWGLGRSTGLGMLYGVGGPL